jgi:hypothetical protein
MAYFIGKASVDLTMDEAWGVVQRAITPPERIAATTPNVALCAMDGTFGYIYILHVRHNGQVGIRLIMDSEPRIREVFSSYKGSEAVDILTTFGDTERKIALKAQALGDRKLTQLRQLADAALIEQGGDPTRPSFFDDPNDLIDPNDTDDLSLDLAQISRSPFIFEDEPTNPINVGNANKTKQSANPVTVPSFVPTPPPRDQPTQSASVLESIFTDDDIPDLTGVVAASPAAKRRNRVPLLAVGGSLALIIVGVVLFLALRGGGGTPARQIDHPAFSLTYPEPWGPLPAEQVAVCKPPPGCVAALGLQPFNFAGVAVVYQPNSAPITQQQLETGYWYGLKAANPAWELIEQRLEQVSGRTTVRLDYRMPDGSNVLRVSRRVVPLAAGVLDLIAFGVSALVYDQNEQVMDDLISRLVIKGE